jgi:microcin C transport system permease protein
MLTFDFGKSYFRDVSVLQLIKEKLPVSIIARLWMTLLTYLRSRFRSASARRCKDGSRFDVWTSGRRHHRLRHPRLPVRRSC